MSEEALRSWLYVPAHDEKKITRAGATVADVVILDLEDGTPASHKDVGRDVVRQALEDLDFGASRRYVRINATGTTRWRGDIEATLPAKPDGYVIAKASSPDAVAAVAEVVREGEPARPPLIAPILTEDVAGVFAAATTAAAHDLIHHVLWGTEDLSASLGAWAVKDARGELTEPFVSIRSFVLLTAALIGRRAVDTPFLALKDSEGLATEARASARMGFAGKQCIHPGQVEATNLAFTPDDRDLERARELVASFERDDAAVVRAHDEMADAPHLIRAKHLIALGARCVDKDTRHHASTRPAG